eukprot:1795337-Rhodomonas_salina.4
MLCSSRAQPAASQSGPASYPQHLNAQPGVTPAAAASAVPRRTGGQTSPHSPRPRNRLQTRNTPLPGRAQRDA